MSVYVCKLYTKTAKCTNKQQKWVICFSHIIYLYKFVSIMWLKHINSIYIDEKNIIYLCIYGLPRNIWTSYKY